MQLEEGHDADGHLEDERDKVSEKADPPAAGPEDAEPGIPPDEDDAKESIWIQKDGKDPGDGSPTHGPQ